MNDAVLRALMSQTHIGVAVFDAEGRFLLVNDRLAQWNGLPAREHQGKRLADVGRDLELRAGPLLNAALAGRRSHIRIAAEAPGDPGVMNIWDMKYVPVRNADDDVMGAAAIVRMRTGERLAQRQIQRAYAYLEAIFDTAPVALSVWDRDLRLVRANALVLEWNGIDHARVPGRHISELFPTVWGSVEHNYRQALAGEHCTVDVDRRARGQESGPQYVQISYSPIEEDGEVIGVLVSSTDITQHVRQSRALHEAYAQLAAVFDTAAVSLSVWDHDLRLVRANARMLEWNALDRDGAIGRLVADLFPEVWPAVEDKYRRALAGEHLTIEVDRRLRGQDSGPQWVEMAYALVRLDGEIIGGVLSSMDITDRVHHAQALEEAYAQLEAVFEAATVSISVWDVDLRLIRANRTMLAWNALDESAYGRSVTDLFPTAWPAAAKNYRRALRGERFTVTFDRRRNGVMTGPEQLEMSGGPVEVGGRIVGVAIVNVDITRIARHTRALEEAYAQLQAVFDNVPVGIAVYDRDFRILRMNDEMARWHDVCRDEAVGRLAAEVHGHMWESTSEQRARALAGEPSQVEVDRRAYGKSTGPAQVLTSYTPVVVDGQVVGITVSSTDITARVQASRRAEAAVQFRDDLMSIASHELRTPLTSIIGFAERLERIAEHGAEVTLADASEDLTLIRSESERMSRTLDMLMDLVGLAAGSVKMEHEPVALAPLVRQQVRMARERHPQLHVTEDISPETVIVDSDGDRIAQVVSNLIENAAKYAGDGAHVRVRLLPIGPRALVQVEDDGPGIPLDEQESVFARRYRGRTSGANGLGLGLYLSRTIASRLGGSLTVRSIPGEGATLTLALPRDVAPGAGG